MMMMIRSVVWTGSLSMFILAALLVQTCWAQSSTTQMVSAWATIVDTTKTNGLEVIVGYAPPTPISNTSVEFVNFALNSTNIDIQESLINITLNDAASLPLTQLADGQYFRYYFEFIGTSVVSASLENTPSALQGLVNVTLLHAGFYADLIDQLKLNFPTLIQLDTGGMVVLFGPGADLTLLGGVLTVDYSLPGPPTPSPTPMPNPQAPTRDPNVATPSPVTSAPVTMTASTHSPTIAQQSTSTAASSRSLEQCFMFYGAATVLGLLGL